MNTPKEYDFEKEYDKVINYNKLSKKMRDLEFAKQRFEKKMDAVIEELKSTTEITPKKFDLDAEEALDNLLGYVHFETGIKAIEKEKETTLKIFDFIKSRISKRLETAKKEASEFYKKYFVFTSREIIDEFNSVFKYLGHKKGIVDFSTYAYLQNQKDSKIKMTVKDFKAETAKRHGKDYDFEKDDTSEYKIYFSICENDKFSHTQLLYELPLDFDMKMADSTKLEDHLTTKVTVKKRNLRGEPEYHTELMVKPSAYDKFIVPLDFTKIDSTQTIVREVYNKLMSKVRMREIAREDRARAQQEKELSL